MSQLLFELIGVALGLRPCLSNVPTREDWLDLEALAIKHGVTGLGFLALKQLEKKKQLPPDDVKQKWLASAVQVEMNYERLSKLAEKLHEQFAEAGIKVLEMKGRSIAKYYPQTTLRVFGDIDIYSVGEKKRIDDLLKAICSNFDDDFYRHSECKIDGILVENHRFITDVRGQQRWVKLEEHLQNLASIRLATAPTGGLYQPDELFVFTHFLYHAQSHFIYERLTVKFMAEWCLLLHNRNELPLILLSENIKHYGLLPMATYLSALCIKRLMLNENLLPQCVTDNLKNVRQDLLERMESDMMDSDYHGFQQDTLHDRIMRSVEIFKRRWKLEGILGISVWSFLLDKMFATLSRKKNRVEETGILSRATLRC